MGSERILVEHLWNRRAGIEKDYSIPDETTFLRRVNQPSGGRADNDDGGCYITR